ncbi:MAG: integration host factor subunit beta [Candidatus Sulfobium sp.]
MTKSVLGEKVAERAEDLTSAQVEIIVYTVFESMQSALIKGDKVEIRGFGNFRLKTRKPRQARNPKTGEPVEVPAKKVLSFKVGKELREMLNRE